MVEFVRLADVVNKKKDMRVVSVTVIPTITDCSGRIWFTGLHLQEELKFTGYAPHTEITLQKYREDGKIKAPIWFNGIVRSKETVVLFNLGKTADTLDINIYPKADMAADGETFSGRWWPAGGFSGSHERRGRCGPSGRFEGMHQKWRSIQKRWFLSIQRCMGFQTQCGG